MKNYLREEDGVMDIEGIIKRKKELDSKLKMALATMEKKDTIKEIYREIKENQTNCPHDIQFSLSNQGTCPYCGKNREE